MEREHEQLLMRYLDGELDEAGAQELNETLEADRAFREEFLQYMRQERVMRVLLDKDHASVLSQQVLDQLRAQEDGEDFVQSVQKEITGRNVRVKRKPRPGSSARRRSLRLSKRSAPRHTSWALPMSIAALLALGVGIYLFTQKGAGPQPEILASIVEVSGKDATAEGASGSRALQTGSTLAPGDALRTGSSSSLTLKYRDGTTVELSASSALTIAQTDEKSAKQLGLERGALTADVRPQPEGAPFSVKTAQALATVKGTVLTVSTNVADTRLDVKRGKVEFERLADHANVLVAEGRYAVAGPVGVAFESQSLVPEAPPQPPLHDAKAEEFLAKVYEPARGPKLPYRLFVPARNEKTKKYPLVIFLHGIGEKGNDNALQLSNNANGALVFVSAKTQTEHPCFMMIPQSASGWWGEYVDVMAQLLTALPAEHNIDPDRIYLTGLSSGGSGTWDMITRQPRLFAAAVPICGSGDPSKASAATAIAIWNFHTADDPTMAVQGSRGMIAALRKAGAHPYYTEYATGGHFSAWVRGYSEPSLISWLMAQKRGRDATPPATYPFPH